MSERKPNFRKDDEIYGKFGEDDFVEFCSGYGLNVKNVSKELPYQLSDIDFLVSKGKIEAFDDKKLIFSRNTEERNIYKFEVKTDTRSFETRNVVYEVISHDFAGCMASSKADFIYYVFVDDVNGDGSEIIKKEVWKINLAKWRSYLREFFFSGKISVKEMKDTYGMRGNNYDDNDDRVANVLCKIETLEEHGIAKRLW